MKKLRVLALGFLAITAIAIFAASAPKQPVFFFDTWKALEGKPDAVKELVENTVLDLLDSVTNIESMDLRFDISKRLPLDEPITQAEAAVIASRIFDIEADIIKRYPLLASSFEDFKCELEIKFEKEKAEKPVIFDYSKLCGYFYFMQEFFRKNAGYTLFDNPDPLHAMTKGEFIKFLVRVFSLYSKAAGLGRGVDYVKVANELENRLRREYKIDVPNVGYVTTFELMFLTKEGYKVYGEDPKPLAGTVDGNKYDKLTPIIKLDIFSNGKKLGVNEPAPRWWAYGLTYYVFSWDIKLAYEEPSWLNPSAPSEPKVAYSSVDGYTGFKDTSFVCTVPITNGKVKQPEEFAKYFDDKALKQVLKLEDEKGKCEGGLTFNLFDVSGEQRRELAMLYLAMAIITGDSKYLKEFFDVGVVASPSKLASLYAGKKDEKAEKIAEAYKEAPENETFWNYKPDKDHFSYKAYFKAKAEEYMNKARQYHVLAQKALDEGDKSKAEFLARKMANYVIAWLIFERAASSDKEAVKWLGKIGGNALDIALYKESASKEGYEDAMPVKEFHDIVAYKFDNEVIKIYRDRLNKQLNAKFVSESELPNRFKTKFEYYGLKGFEPLEFYLPRYKKLDKANLIPFKNYKELLKEEPLAWVIKGSKDGMQVKLALLDNSVIIDRLEKLTKIDPEKFKYFDEYRKKLKGERVLFKDFAKYLSEIPYRVPETRTDEATPVDNKRVALVPAESIDKPAENPFVVVPVKTHYMKVGEDLVRAKKWYRFLEDYFYFKIGQKIGKKEDHFGRKGYIYDIYIEPVPKTNNFVIKLKRKNDGEFGGAIIGIKDNLGFISSLYGLIAEFMEKIIMDSSVRLWTKECFKSKSPEIEIHFMPSEEEIYAVRFYPFARRDNDNNEIVSIIRELAAQFEEEFRKTLKEVFDKKLEKLDNPKIVAIVKRAKSKIDSEGVEAALAALKDNVEDNLSKGEAAKLVKIKEDIITEFDTIYNEKIKPEIVRAFESRYIKDNKPFPMIMVLAPGTAKLKYTISFFGILDALGESLLNILKFEPPVKPYINSNFKYYFVREQKKSYPVGAVYENVKIKFMPTLDRLNYNRNYGKAATLGSIKEFIGNYGNSKGLGEIVENDPENILGYWKGVALKLEKLTASNDSPIAAKVVIDGVNDVDIVKSIEWEDKTTCSISIEIGVPKFESYGALYSVKIPGTEFYTESKGISPALSIGKENILVAFINIIDYDPTAIEPDITIGENKLPDEAKEIVDSIKEIADRYQELGKALSGRQILASKDDLLDPKFIAEKLYDKRHTLRSLQLWVNEGGKRIVLDEIYRIRK